MQRSSLGAIGAFARGISGQVSGRVDFDVNATTALHPVVREQLCASLADPSLDGNPASAHQLGQKARACLEQARRRLAAAIDADPLSIVWTSGGTEANVLALQGVVHARIRTKLPHALALSPLEHPCVSETAKSLQSQGVPCQWLEVDAQGRLDPATVSTALNPETGVLCCMLASHELGNLYPVPELASLARARLPELWVHSDAVQGLGKQALSFAELGVDSLALSAHKFGGPKGVGALVLKRGAKLESLFKGGSQERGFRAGTPSVRLAMAMATAAELAVAGQAAHQASCSELYAQLRALVSQLPDIDLLGDPESHLGNTLCLLSRVHRGQDLMIALDMEGYGVSTGAACSVGASTASAGIMAMGIDPQRAKGVLRISWGPARSMQDAQGLVQALKQILLRLDSASAEIV